MAQDLHSNEDEDEDEDDYEEDDFDSQIGQQKQADDDDKTENANILGYKASKDHVNSSLPSCSLTGNISYKKSAPMFLNEQRSASQNTTSQLASHTQQMSYKKDIQVGVNGTFRVGLDPESEQSKV